MVHPSAYGSKFLAVGHTDQIIEFVAVPSTGTVGDSCQNLVAGVDIASCETEL